MLGELASTPQSRIAEYRIRKNRYDHKTFRIDEHEHAVSEGWELVRENQSSSRYQKIRPHDQQLENELWCLLYNFGYPILNIGRKFQIETVVNGQGTIAKQIDVFAHDDETVIVAECKSSEMRTKRQLQKDIGEFANNQRLIANTLRRHFNGKLDQKIIWLFVTRNIEWSQPDKARALDANIKIVTEKEFFYYKEIAKRVGHAARYQFQAEFLAGSKVKALSRKVYALQTTINGHRAYTFFAAPQTLLPIAFVNHRDLRDPSSAPSYQRLIHRQRVKDIAEFLKAGGFFPNSVIINFKQKPRFDPIKPKDGHGICAGELTLPDKYKSAYIIDGQHRLYGYSELTANDKQPHLPILGFEDIPVSEETKIFSEINSKQKSVSKKLLDEITGEIKLDASDKREQMRAIASRAFDLIRDDDDGPLGGRIAGAEIKPSEDAVLTIPYLVDATIQSGILGKASPANGVITYHQGPLFWDRPRDAITALSELLTEYFDLFRKANAQRWALPKALKFASNPGASALIRLLGDLIAYMSSKEHQEPRDLHPKEIIERIERYLSPCIKYFKEAAENDLEAKFQIPFGSGGPRVFQHRLRELVHADYPAFNPPGYDDDLRKYDANRRQEADEKVRDIVEAVHRFVINDLRNRYGGGSGDDFLHKAVDNKEILKKAAERQIDDNNAKDLGTYLDFIDLKRIVETAKNWDSFKAFLNIPLNNEPTNRKCTGWMVEINKARRVNAHPYNRGYDDGEFAMITQVFSKLVERKVITS